LQIFFLVDEIIKFKVLASSFEITYLRTLQNPKAPISTLKCKMEAASNSEIHAEAVRNKLILAPFPCSQ
jgi:hypothetical protein